MGVFSLVFTNRLSCAYSSFCPLLADTPHAHVQQKAWQNCAAEIMDSNPTVRIIFWSNKATASGIQTQQTSTQEVTKQ
jgi:hypothetical protein